MYPDQDLVVPFFKYTHDKLENQKISCHFVDFGSYRKDQKGYEEDSHGSGL